MATTLPSFQRTIDNAFTTTWYDIQAQAADAISQATVVWAWLKMKGCFKTQEGGNLIERTVVYALPTDDVKAVVKGDVLGQGESENRTAYFWTFRNLSTHIQRSLFDDRANRGKYRIINYVTDRIEKAQKALRQVYEQKLLRAQVTDESGKDIQGLNDLIAPVAGRATGTYGGIARPTNYTADVPDAGNTWNSVRYKQFTANKEINLLTDMKNFYNTVTNNQEAPDGLLTTQSIYETYEDFGLDATQIVGNAKLLDLGFNTLKFKGVDMFWSPNVNSGEMKFMNSSDINVVYDPMVWFSMTEWKTIPLQVERIAHILCTMNIVSNGELRRHGLMYT